MKYRHTTYNVDAEQFNINFKEWPKEVIFKDIVCSVATSFGPRYIHSGDWIVKYQDGTINRLSDKEFKEGFILIVEKKPKKTESRR